MSDKLKWGNLKSMKCPKCSQGIEFSINITSYLCIDQLVCRFKISQEAFERTVNSVYKKSQF